MTDSIAYWRERAEIAEGEMVLVRKERDAAIARIGKYEMVGLVSGISVGEMCLAQARRITELEAENEANAWKVSPAMAQARIDGLFAENEKLKAELAAMTPKVKEPEVKECAITYYPVQCKCGHLYLEKYQFEKPLDSGVVGFCWCGFCKTRRNVYAPVEAKAKVGKVDAPLQPTPTEKTATVGDVPIERSGNVAILTAACAAHRACCGREDDGKGLIHGYCVVCGVPWPCDVAKVFVDAANKLNAKQ